MRKGMSRFATVMFILGIQCFERKYVILGNLFCDIGAFEILSKYRIKRSIIFCSIGMYKEALGCFKLFRYFIDSNEK